MNILPILISMMVFALIAVVIIAVIWHQVDLSRKRNFIRHFKFPPGLFDKLQRQHPNMNKREFDLVAQALRQFFLAFLISGKKPVHMPSKVADDLWHEFILYTKQYNEFCQRAFGQFFHHVPSAVMGKAKSSNEGLRRIWWHTCKEENINPRKPTRVPLLFAVDKKLQVAGGFYYSTQNLASNSLTPKPDQSGGGAGSCGGGCGGGATHSVHVFSDTSIDGSTDGFGDSGGGDGGGDSGCGGGGCGGD